MKIKKKIFGVVVISLLLINTFANELLHTDQADLPEHVGVFAVDNDVRKEANKRSTIESRILYLNSVVNSLGTNSNEIANFKKASAIRLLGAIKSTNSIGILISNLTFAEIKSHDRPSLSALAAIGEPSVPVLIGVLKNPDASPETCECAVQALMFIKQANPHIEKWLTFVKEQKSLLPTIAWERLSRYGSILD
jgi:hypothetical protein